MFSHEVRSDQEQEIQEPSDEIWNASCASNSLYMVWYSNTVIQWLIDFFMQSIQVFFFQSLWMSHKMHRKVPSWSLLNVNHWVGDSPEIPIQMLTAYLLCTASKLGTIEFSRKKWGSRAVMRWILMDFWCWHLFSRERERERKVLRAAFRDSEPDHAWSLLVETERERDTALTKWCSAQKKIRIMLKIECSSSYRWF